jgi:hypothetical protein
VDIHARPWRQVAALRHPADLIRSSCFRKDQRFQVNAPILGTSVQQIGGEPSGASHVNLKFAA